MTLRRRLFLVLGVLVLLLSGAGVWAVVYLEHTEVAQVDRELRSGFFPLALAAAPGVVHPVLANPVRPPLRRPLALRARSVVSSELFVAVISGGTLRSVVRPISNETAVPITPAVSSPPSPRAFRIVTVGSRSGTGSWRAALVAVRHRQVLVAYSLEGVDGTVSRFRLGLEIAGAIVFVALAAAAFWIGRLGLRPIAEVASVADEIAAGNRRRRVRPLPAGTEAAHLGRAVNLMLDEQAATEARLRQFIADASHDLRTPLSVIRGLAGLWRQGELRSGAEADDAMRRIGQETARMSRLVDDLLLLARLDEGQPLEVGEVDLGELARSVTDGLVAAHPSRTVELETESAVVVGDAARVGQAISNLVANALVHTAPHARVAVRVATDGRSATVAVADEGPGMDREGVEHAFDRFWRAESSRTRPGTGLGLSIVAAIVAAHGGEVTLDSDPARGTVVTVRLPLAGPPEPAPPDTLPARAPQAEESVSTL